MLWKKIFWINILFLCLAGCSIKNIFKPPLKSGIKGRMVCGEILLKDGYVYIYKSAEKGFKDEPFVIGGPTREDGYFEINLSPGKYYVLGRKKADGTKSSIMTEKDYFSYYGGNPAYIKEGKYTFVGLTSMKIFSEKSIYNLTNSANNNIFQGKVTYQGMPVEGAYIYVYMDASSEFKGPGFAMSGPTGEDGFFKFLDLPENNYYVIARKRNSKDKAGPVVRGDYFGYYLNNPINIKNDSIIEIDISTAIKSGEIGELDEGFSKSSETYIKGIVKDKNNKPVEGVYVFAYNERVIGHKKPSYLSQKTNSIGEYILYFDKFDTYYLGVRQFYGDSPQPGELYGLYDGSPDHSIKIKKGDRLENINFVADPILLNRRK